MQRQLKLANNDLSKLKSSLDFWREKTLDEMQKLLWTPFILNDGLTWLGASKHIDEIATSIRTCLQEHANAKMVDDYFTLAINARQADSDGMRGSVGEKFLQISVIVNFRLGDFEKAAFLAGILADTYYTNHHNESDFNSGYFNKIAGLAYELCGINGNTEKAAHHYNQCLSQPGYQPSPQEAESMASYLSMSNANKQGAGMTGSLPQNQDVKGNQSPGIGLFSQGTQKDKTSAAAVSIYRDQQKSSESQAGVMQEMRMASK